MAKIPKHISRAYQRKWYQKQKHAGLVYIIRFKNGDSYVGSTTNSMNKRLWQHRAWGPLRDANWNKYTCQVLEFTGAYKAREQYWIEMLKPTLNISRAHGSKYAVPYQSFKGGIIFGEKWYPTLKLLWQTLGKVPYGTFKSRLHRFKRDIYHALGLESGN